MKSFFGFIFGLIQEVYSLLFATVFYFFDQVRHDGKGSEKAIILIHGYLHNSSGWALVRSRLKKAGYDAIYTVNLGHPFKSTAQYAKVLEDRIDAIGAKEVILIGHSMGGIIAAYYTIAHPEKVRLVITVGSPLQGSYTSCFPVSDSFRQMYPGSKFLTELKRGMEQSQVPFVHIGGTMDFVIIPSSSMVPHFAPNTTCVTLPFVGHTSHLTSKRTTEAILDALKNFTTENTETTERKERVNV